jgi:hypothetical protein
VLPSEAPAAWVDGDLWTATRAIPGVTVVTDTDGLEARRFGAMTSGFFVLYASDGRLLSSGGMVPARGHEGFAPGQERVLQAVSATVSMPSVSPVFGCSLEQSAHKARAVTR